jgi:GNAT superfamily N-acetyltransferase
MAPEVRYDVMRPHQDATIDHLLTNATVWVLTPAAVPEEVCGYIVFHPGTIHYFYVKQSYRKLGFATKLLATFGPFKQHTHATTASKALLARHGSKYNPFLLNAAQPKEEFEWRSST